jgi:hypothetical protein
MGCLQSKEKMNMITYSADLRRDGLKSAHCAAQVGVKSGHPLLSHCRLSILGAEDDVVMEAEMR